MPEEPQYRVVRYGRRQASCQIPDGPGIPTGSMSRADY